MKILAYSRRPDETRPFEHFCRDFGVELLALTEPPTLQTIPRAEGFSAVSIITTPLNGEFLCGFYNRGVRFISTRSIGYDHIDTRAAKALGIRIGNVSYSPDTVANYAVMFMLMAVRKVKAIVRLAQSQDYSLAGVQGREMRNLTVGIAGTGRIGKKVIGNLTGFGCRILAFDKYESEEVRASAEYVSWEELIAKSDLISLHMPAAQDNYHIVNAESIARMKDGVYIINTARGSLIDTDAFLDAVESGKIGGAALDVVEDEQGLYYNNLRGQVIPNRALAALRSYPNVIITPHTAFYTDQAVSDMVENSLRSCIAFIKGEDNPWEIKLA
ncbi:MAG: lactate dehydrogenase [Spirochaetaceae bacterium]|jgi:D-lactate dehydrogenase|nr:lactate dehydrogenase [Spirochaetaceae bacterium]